MVADGTATQWAPSWWGRRITGSPDWRLRLRGPELFLTIEGSRHQVNVELESEYLIQPGNFWTDVTFHPGQGRELKVDGLRNDHAVALIEAIHSALTDKRIRDDAAWLLGQHQTIEQWLEQRDSQVRTCADERRWFTHDLQAAVLATRPSVNASDIRARLKNPGVAASLGQIAEAIERDLVDWETDPHPAWMAFNQAHIEQELVACKDLFDRVEKAPLTQEQARAVICFDNRVQVVASAGSGKTSTMVAKAAYAIYRGFVAPERIVLLAFNKKAAIELKERAAKSFARLGMEGVSVEALTFHSLGLKVVGKATGQKPDVPDWATKPALGVRKLTEIVDQLKDRDTAFRNRWDLFRFVFARDLTAFGCPDRAESWDAQGKGSLVTNLGEHVKSEEEALIASYLFLNGVKYRYEDRYKHPTADEDHRPYKPDFYYPDVDLYHEHFALNAKGECPPHFEGYMEGIVWKRDLHKRMGTALFETTSHGLRDVDDLQRLGDELTSRGIVLDPNPDREIPQDGQKPMEAVELVKLIRTFMSHAKSNCLTQPALQKRLDAISDVNFRLRYRMFLDIAEPIMRAWDEALAAEDGIDFEDMLNMAAEHLEGGHYEAPYELVMADEFQDASRARARLCRALVKRPNRFLFAVGDDWQSINRFAGADVSVMTGFRQWFGHGQELKLEQTFRCPQALCDASSAFVGKNPVQIPKRVHSDTPAQGPVLHAFQVDSQNHLAEAIDQFVMKLADGVRDGTIPPGRSGKVSVYVLGRYNADEKYVPERQARFNRWVEVSFLTVHRSKGSEADYVILPEMVSIRRRRSFPNTQADDPVLALAMPNGDTYPLGEERRLFYVALTRARRSVAMFTARGYRSIFLNELIEDGVISLVNARGEQVQETTCPACKQGAIIVKEGRNGAFEACSNFPPCRYKPKGRAFTASTRSTNRPSFLAAAVRTPLSGGFKPSSSTATPDPVVLAALIELRDRLARGAKVPAFVLFHDSTLKAVAASCPTNLEELRHVPGLGATKLTRYGPDILTAVRLSSTTSNGTARPSRR